MAHNKRQSKIMTEEKLVSRLDRITPCHVIFPEFADPADLRDPLLQQEMERAWESDWADL